MTCFQCQCVRCCWFPYVCFELEFDKLRKESCCVCCASTCYAFNYFCNHSQILLFKGLIWYEDCIDMGESPVRQTTTVVGGSSSDQWAAFSSDYMANNPNANPFCLPCQLINLVLRVTGSLIFYGSFVLVCPAEIWCWMMASMFSCKSGKQEENPESNL